MACDTGSLSTALNRLFLAGPASSVANPSSRWPCWMLAEASGSYRQGYHSAGPDAGQGQAVRAMPDHNGCLRAIKLHCTIRPFSLSNANAAASCATPATELPGLSCFCGDRYWLNFAPLQTISLSSPFSDVLSTAAAVLTLHCAPAGLRSMWGSWPPLLLWQGLLQRRAMWWHPAPWQARQTKRICMTSSR